MNNSRTNKTKTSSPFLIVNPLRLGKVTLEAAKQNPHNNKTMEILSRYTPSRRQFSCI